MADKSNPSSDTEQRINQVIAAYLEAVHSGYAPDREELLRQHPDLVAELESFFADHDQFNRLADPLQPVASPGNAHAAETTKDPKETRATPPPPTVSDFDDYELLEEVGRGGMGVVYKARHRTLNRIVALKMILAGSHAGPQDVKRFVSESKAVAPLQHPNIVQLFESGERDGLPYFTMEFVAGGSLAAKLKGTPLPARQAALLVEAITRAIHVAHERNIVHRDLKPSNILLTEGKVEPKIADFGLARRVETGCGLTATGAVLGTPSYMPPEQAQGEGKRVGPKADLYSLGAILYECLTGRPPFQGPTQMDTLLQVLADEPVPPSQLQRKVPNDVETICLKCLDKDPARRYENAEKMADDLAAFLQGRPIAARPVGPFERTSRWCRRNPAVASLIGGVAASLLLGTIVAIALALWALNENAQADRNAETARLRAAESQENEREAKKNAKEAKDNLKLANKSAKEAKDNLKLANKSAKEAKDNLKLAMEQMRLLARAGHALRIGVAEREWRSGNVVRALEVLEGCSWNLRGWEHAHLRYLCRRDGHQNVEAVKIADVPRRRESLTLTGPADGFGSLAFSPNGSRLTLLGGGFGRWVGTDSGGYKKPRETCVDAGIKVWNASTGAELLAREPGFLKNPRLGFTLTAGARARVMSIRNKFRSKFRSRTVSPNGKWRATLLDNTARLFDESTGKEVAHCTVRLSSFLAISPNGKHAVGLGLLDYRGHAISPGGAYDLHVWDVSTGRKLILKGDTKGNTESVFDFERKNRIYCAAFSPDGKQLAACVGKTVRVWDALTWRRIRTFAGVGTNVLVFSPDGKRLVTWQRLWKDGKPSTTVSLKIWDVVNGEEILTIRTHEGCWTFSPDGKRLAAGDDKTVTIWDLSTSTLIRTLTGHAGSVTCVAYTPDGRRLASGSSDTTVKMWDPSTGQEMLTLRGHLSEVIHVVFSPSGRRLATAGKASTGPTSGYYVPQARCTVKVWDALPGKGVLAIGPGSMPVFDRDGERLAFLSSDDIIKTWDAKSEQVVDRYRSIEKRLRNQNGLIGGLRFSLDGEQLALVQDSALKIWDTRLKQEVTPANYKGNFPLPFSPDGTRRTSVTRDSVKIWEVQTKREVRSFPRHSDLAIQAFSPYGKRLAFRWSRRPKFGLNLYDVETGKPVCNLPGFSRIVFTPDGKRFAAMRPVSYVVGGRRVPATPGAVKVCNAATGKEIITIEGSFRCLAYSPDGKWLVTVRRGEFSIWDASKGKEILAYKCIALPKETFWVSSLAYCPNGKWLTYVLGKKAPDGQSPLFVHEVKLLDIASFQTPASKVEKKKPEKPLLEAGHTDAVRSVAFSPGGKWLATGSDDKTLQISDAKTGKPIRTLKGHTGRISSTTISPDGKWLASGSWDNTIKIWNTKTWDAVTLGEHDLSVSGVAFNPDGTRLASSSADGTVKIWDLKTRQAIRTLKPSTNVRCVAISPDGKRLACGSSDRTVTVWDVSTGQLIHTLKGHGGWITSVSFSPDGSRLASASWDKTVRVWDVATGRNVLKIKAHSKDVASVAYSPKGQRLVTGSDDKTIKLWDARTGKLVRTHRGHNGAVYCVAFSPDGKRLASGSRDHTVSIWNAQNGDVALLMGSEAAKLLRKTGHHADTLLRKMDKKLAEARTVQLSFEIALNSPNVKSTVNGALTLAKGNKARIELTLDLKGKRKTAKMISNGTKMMHNGVVQPTPKDLNRELRFAIRRVGMVSGTTYGAKEKQFTISDPRLGKKAKVGERDCQIIHHTFTKAGQPIFMSTRTWINLRTFLPLKRVLDSPNTKGSITETYSDFRINGEVGETTFELPK